MRIVPSLDALKELVGQEIGVSDWVLVDQARVDAFAEATGDHQWIHVDPVRAAMEMPGGRTIAHGYLTLSLIPLMLQQIMRLEGISMGVNYGSNKVRFTGMVPTGSRIRGRQTLLTAEPKGKGLQITNEIVVEIEGSDRPAMIAETVAIFYP